MGLFDYQSGNSQGILIHILGMNPENCNNRGEGGPRPLHCLWNIKKVAYDAGSFALIGKLGQVIPVTRFFCFIRRATTKNILRYFLYQF